MTDPPASVKVGPYVYSVGMDEAKIRQFEHERQAGFSGHSDHGALEIHIDPHNAPAYQRETLWHEIKHCVLRLSGFEGKASEEDIICRTSPMELAVLRDNPDLVRYLLDDDQEQAA